MTGLGDSADRGASVARAAPIRPAAEPDRPLSEPDARGDLSEPTPPCVAGLTTPADRLAALRTLVLNEREPLVTITHLLRLCRDEHPVLWSRMDDPACCGRVDRMLGELSALLPPPGLADHLTGDVRDALADALQPVSDTPVVVVARALAELLDDRYGHTVFASFRRRSPYQPSVGDPIPLDSPDLRRMTALAPTTPPWRLAHRLDETRHVRLAGEWATQFRVVFDYSLVDTLSGLISSDTVVATCHPNASLDEIDLPRGHRQRSFPVRPAAPELQRRTIDSLLATAVAEGASIALLPELCVDEALAWELHDWVRRPGGPRLLVAGSYHHQVPMRAGTDHAAGRRLNTAVAWVRGHERPLLHDKHSPADRPVHEDIQPHGWPEQRIYVTADGWHLAIAICRDLLNPRAVQALSEAGANLILVPAMSETLVPFAGPVAQLVGDNQALVVVANNPAQWSRPGDPTARRPARVLVGHPGFGQLTRWVPAADPAPGISVLQVGSGELKWRPCPAGSAVRDASRGPHHRAATAPIPPRWVSTLTAETCAWTSDMRSEPTVTLRNAAVLVVLIDRPGGPQVLLTQRTADLADFPGQMVFPGGAADAGDASPLETALREAREETGLDPASVHVIGLLPPHALVDRGFLVTPVLAWSTDPAYPGATNLAEVEAVAEIPLAELHAEGDRRSTSIGDTRAIPGGRGYGPMTAALLDLLATLLLPVDGHPGGA